MTATRKPGPGDQPLVGASEAADLMNVELSTFSHLRRREEATPNSKFPSPVAVLRCGPIWKTNEIKRFASKYVAPRPGPKPSPAPRKSSKVVNEVLATNAKPTKAAAKAAAGNGGNSETKTPTKKVVGAKRAKRVAKAGTLATV